MGQQIFYIKNHRLSPFSCGPYANPFHRVIAAGATCRGDRHRPVREQNHHLRQSCVRENISAPACAMTRIQRFARASAGRPYSAYRAHKHDDHKPRDHQGVQSPQGSTDIPPHRAYSCFAPKKKRCAISQMRPTPNAVTLGRMRFWVEPHVNTSYYNSFIRQLNLAVKHESDPPDCRCAQGAVEEIL